MESSAFSPCKRRLTMAATADLDDDNIIDPFHLDAYGETTVNYNRDVEIFPVLKAMLERIQGVSPYNSPTDMGVNMAASPLLMMMRAVMHRVAKSFAATSIPQRIASEAAQENKSSTRSSC